MPTNTQKNSLNFVYVNRVNQVINYVEQNLSGDLSLYALSKVAHISPYHFHRIFSIVCNETIHQYVVRKRIERIASILISNNSLSISALAYSYGFDNPSSFSRAFKKYYGISASELIKRSNASVNKLVSNKSKKCKEPISVEDYLSSTTSIRDWSQQNAKFKIVNFPEVKLAYVRHKGSFDQTLNTFNKLKTWAKTVNELDLKQVKWLMLIHDNPAVVGEGMITQSAGLKITDDQYDKISVEHEVSKMTIPPSKYLRGQFKIKTQDFKNAWDSMSMQMIDHDYISGDGYYFELFHTNSLFNSNQKHLVDIYIPI